MFLREISWRTYAAAFVISLFLFGAGVLAGVFASRELAGSLSSEIANVRARAVELELVSLIEPGGSGCGLLEGQLNEFDAQTASIDRRVDLLGRQRGPFAQDYVQLKREFTLMQLRDLLLVQKLANACNRTVDTALFFYTNDCPDCTRQGEIGPLVKQARPEARIYAFDAGLGSPAVGALMGLYGVKSFPSLVVNGKLVEGFTSAEGVLARLS